jgi:hypothetical protein
VFLISFIEIYRIRRILADHAGGQFPKYLLVVALLRELLVLAKIAQMLPL